MRCPCCGEEQIRVIDSRSTNDGQEIRRRRECACGFRFTTHEVVEMLHPPQVIKADGRRQAFDHLKLQRSIESVCHKASSVKVAELVAAIGEQLAPGTTVTSQQLGQDVLNRLEPLDVGVYVRYACQFYRCDSTAAILATTRVRPKP